MVLEIAKTHELSEGESFPGVFEKSGIAIHHTVGGPAASTFEWCQNDKTKSGYDNAYGEYQNLSDRYLTHLRRPSFSLGSTVGLCLGAAGAGVIVGAIIND